MFICDKCLVREYENRLPSVHTLRSYGRCEICKDNGPCNDIPSSVLVPKELELKQTAPQVASEFAEHIAEAMSILDDSHPIIKSDPVFMYYMDLSIGDKFIKFPVENHKDDPMGHRGILGQAQCIFIKMGKDDDEHNNALNINDGLIYYFPEETQIIKLKI